MRNGLSYQQAMHNCNKKAWEAYYAAIAAGKTSAEAQQAAFDVYHIKMNWYEGK